MAKKKKKEKDKKEEKQETEDQNEKEAQDYEELLKKKEEEIAELTDMVKRTRAELINYQNRVERETKTSTEYANANLVKEILPVLDSFELALKNTKDLEKFKDGVEMIFAQLFDILKQQGLHPIDTEGKQFDPHLHEVLMKVPSEEEEDVILEVLQKGYKYKDRVIRHAKVKISG